MTGALKDGAAIRARANFTALATRQRLSLMPGEARMGEHRLRYPSSPFAFSSLKKGGRTPTDA
jgi:hypothetical protein